MISKVKDDDDGIGVDLGGLGESQAGAYSPLS